MSSRGCGFMCRAHRVARALVVVFLGLTAWFEPAMAAPPSAQTETLGQVAGILDYIAGDYRGAVGPDGAILDPGEYAEQRSLAEDARALLTKVGIDNSDPLQQRMGELSSALAERRSPAAVTQLCREART